MRVVMLRPGAARLFQLVLGRPPTLSAAEAADWLERLELALDTLNPRHALVVRQRFLRDPRPTLEHVGRFLGVTRERVRQLEARALAKLRHPSRRLFLEGCGELMAVERSGLSSAARVRTRVPAVRFVPASLRERLLIEVRDIEMSARARHAFARYSVRFIGDLVTKTRRELSHMVGVSTHTRGEITSMLDDLGLSVGMRVAGWATMKARKLWGCGSVSDPEKLGGTSGEPLGDVPPARPPGTRGAG
jgi:hypothetical protein